jgi:iron complex transport system substrate-binding protein
MHSFTKTLAIAILLTLTLALLAACGNKQTDEPPAPTEQGIEVAPTSETAEASRTYTDATGQTITVPAELNKVMAINYVGDLLALGVKPAYTTAYNLNTFDSLLGGVQSIGDRPVSPEAVTKAEPDLIITDDTGDDASENEQLSKIAPTATITFWTEEPFAHLNELAKLLGKEQEAASWIDSYETKVAAAKETLHGAQSPADATALLLIISGKDMGISGIRNGGYTLYRQLGFQTPAAMQPLLDKSENFGWETVTLEGLSVFAPDHLFVEMDDDSEITQSTFKALQESSVWQSLKAVQSKQTYTVTNKWGLGDATSLSLQLDEALEQMTP